jgi:hypothetical protein
MYDMSHPVTVTGVVKRFEWTNPHAYIYLDVKDDKGNVLEWHVEMMALNPAGRPRNQVVNPGAEGTSRSSVRHAAQCATLHTNHAGFIGQETPHDDQGGV